MSQVGAAALGALPARSGRSGARAGDSGHEQAAAAPRGSARCRRLPQSASRVAWSARAGGRQRAQLADSRSSTLAAARGALARARASATARRREDEALAERVGGEPVGAVQAGARALADRVQARDRRARVQVGRRSRPSCSARPARPGPARAPGRDRRRAGRSRRSGSSAGSIARMSRPTERSPELLELGLDRPRDLIARCELVDEALAGGVEERRALAADRLGDEEALAAGTPMTAVGWNCISSRSASAAPARWASSRPTPCEPGGLVVRAHSAAAPPVAMITARAEIDAAVVAEQAAAALRPAPAAPARERPRAP